MKKIIILTLTFISIAYLSGCGTSLKAKKEFLPIPGEKFTYQVTSKVALPDNAMGIFKARLDSQLAASGKSAQPGAKGVSQVSITVTTYEMRHGAARAMLGILAGKDTMVSIIEIKDPLTNEVKNSFEVESFNISAWGTSKGMIEDQADQIISTLTGVPVK